MSYALGKRSLSKLRGVHPKLVAVVQRAIQLTEIDFSVHDGLRTAEVQAEYVRTGVSKTLKSKHLAQADGFGHAVDLVPYINGRLRWEWEPIYRIATAVEYAAMEQRVLLRWGGVWDKTLSECGKSPEEMKQAVRDYCIRHPGPDFIDGPHYELIGG